MSHVKDLSKSSHKYLVSYTDIAEYLEITYLIKFKSS